MSHTWSSCRRRSAVSCCSPPTGAKSTRTRRPASTSSATRRSCRTAAARSARSPSYASLSAGAVAYTTLGHCHTPDDEHPAPRARERRGRIASRRCTSTARGRPRVFRTLLAQRHRLGPRRGLALVPAPAAREEAHMTGGNVLTAATRRPRIFWGWWIFAGRDRRAVRDDRLRRAGHRRLPRADDRGSRLVALRVRAGPPRWASGSARSPGCLIGPLIDRYGAATDHAHLGTTLSGVALVGVSQVEELWQFILVRGALTQIGPLHDRPVRGQHDALQVVRHQPRARDRACLAQARGSAGLFRRSCSRRSSMAPAGRLAGSVMGITTPGADVSVLTCPCAGSRRTTGCSPTARPATRSRRRRSSNSWS